MTGLWRRMSPPSAYVALVALVTVSAVVRFVAALGVHGPWIAPDEMVYALLGRSFWETGESQLFGLSGGWYGFYPYLAGLPLALLGPEAGLIVLKAIQAGSVSLTAVVVYVWALRLVSQWWALSAAAMAVAMPALAYSGLIMTEAAFLPVTTLALFLLARALSSPTWGNQALAAASITLAVGIRFQALALLPTAIVAIALMALLERRPRLVYLFPPVAIAVAVGVALLMLARLVFGQGGALLGSYAGVLDGYEPAGVLLWSFREAGDLFLVVVGVPLVATVMLAAAQLRSRHRRPDPGVSALLSVALAYAAVTVLQIGAFASVHVLHLAERDLITVAPPLFIAFAVWLAWGMPRQQPVSTLVAFAVAVPALLLPARELARNSAVPDAFMALPWRELARQSSLHTVDLVWPLAAALTVCIAVLAPHRAAPVLASVVVVALGSSSLIAQHVIVRNARIDRQMAFGASPTDWIDRAANGPVAYLDDGARWWNDVWHQAYWNERVTTVARLADSSGARIYGGVRVDVRGDGTLAQPDGSRLSERLVVAPIRMTLVGDRERVLERGETRKPLALWHTDGPPTLSMRTDGALANGPVTVTVYDCAHGYLELAVRAVTGMPAVEVSADGLTPVTVPVEPGYVWRVRVLAAPGRDQRTCAFHLVPRGSVIAQEITYRRGRPLPLPQGATLFGGSPDMTHGTLTRETPVPIPSNAPPIGYCLDGKFLSLTAGQARSDPAYRGATVANFVAGIGLTCDPPPADFVHRGFATDDMNVPGGTYPYYAPRSKAP